MSTSQPKQHAFTQEQIKEFESGAGYDQVPKFIMRFSDAIGSVEGRILRYLAHRTLGYSQYATVVRTRDLAAVAGTKDEGKALNWLMSHGVIGRELVTHRGRRTFAYWIHTDYTTWDIPPEVWRKMLALREQGCWDDPRFSSDQLETLDRDRMIRISPKNGYDLTALKGQIHGLVKGEGAAADRPDIGAGAPARQGGSAPNSGAVPAPLAGAVSPQYRGSSAPRSGAVQVTSAPEPQGFVASGKTFERTERSPLRGGDRRQAAPPAGGESESRSGTASPSLDAPATPMPTCDGERTACHPPAAGGETNGSPPQAGNGGEATERPQDCDPVERTLRTNDFHHLRIIARQMYRMGRMMVAEAHAGVVDLGDPTLLPRFHTIVHHLSEHLAVRYEESVDLPEGMRVTDGEVGLINGYAFFGGVEAPLEDPAQADGFHPVRHEPRYSSPEDVEIWSAIVAASGIHPSRHWFHRFLASEQLGSPEGPEVPIWRLDRVDPELILQPRTRATDNLHHLRVMARQLRRLWRPMLVHAHGKPPAEGWSPSVELFAELNRLCETLAISLITRYETELLQLPDDLRTREGEIRSLLKQVHTQHFGGKDEPVGWRFNVKLHPPRYTEPEDREIWNHYLTLIPEDLPDWAVALVRSPEIASLERRPTGSRSGGGGGFRSDDCETEPYGTEEDGPQPP